MADVRELLARFGPRSVRFDLGIRSDVVHAQLDVPGALAFVPPGLGREVLECCHCSDVVRPTRVLMDHVLIVVRKEWARQADLVRDARLSLSLAEVCAGYHGVVTGEQRRELERAREAFEQAKAQCWPKEFPSMLPRVVLAALNEIKKRNGCPNCGARGEIRNSAGVVIKCEKCNGSGVIPVSDRARAEAIGRHVESYRRHWAPAYMWMLKTLSDAEAEAASALRRALREESEVLA
ncbi:hypothetical protein [[Pseudomonas] boreopolis]|uniref:hypothetical protein n=1 Tax=Xanthomonas boreopolis TaxID=86183 RepID=UPI003D9B1435